MSPDIIAEVVERITAEFGFKPKGDFLQQGKCPACGKREMYASAKYPKILRCGRLNRCGREFDAKDLYPDIFDTWSNRYKPTEDNPNAAAEAYLSSARGLKLLGLRGCFSQEEYRDYDRNITSATVRFQLPGGSHWERIIDQPGRFEKKAHFKKGASYRGHVWAAPDQGEEAQAKASRIFITEGIFDALSLRQAGFVAVSAMSCNNWPDKWLEGLKTAIAAHKVIGAPELVFAFDIGKAGTEYTRRFVDRAREEGWQATAAQPRPEGESEKLDWNDLLIRERLSPEDMEGYLWNGRVLLAESAHEKAVLLWEKHQWASFSFVFDSRTWWATFDEAKINEAVVKDGVSRKAAARRCCNVTEVANCAFRLLYFQRDPVVSESHYYLSLDLSGQDGTYRDKVSPSALAASGEFKKALLGIAPGAQWTGTGFMLDRLVNQQVRGLKTIETLDFTGFSKEHGVYVLGDIAVQSGRVVKINDEDYFDLGKLQLKLRSAERILSIDYNAEAFDTSWVDVIYRAFGGNGMVTLTFWVMSMFAEQIRVAQKSLAFIEMSGIPGTGKSTLIEFLWKLYGREGYEGFDPSKATPAALARNLSRTANIPVVFMEGDRSENAPHSRKFDWDELKALYNGRSVRSRGVKNSGNETYEPPFRASLIIEQNYPVNASPAVMERIMSMTFTKDGWGPDTKTAATQLEHWPMDSLSGAVVHIARAEKAYMARFLAAFPEWETQFLTGERKVRNGRLRKNFAQLHAGLEAMSPLLKIPASRVNELHAHINSLAIERDRALEADHPVVAQFWEVFDYFEGLDLKKDPSRVFSTLNWHRDGLRKIAINLQAFEAACRHAGISAPPTEDLKKHLKSSKVRPFVDATTVNTADHGHQHCWVFLTEAEAKAQKHTAKGK